VPLGENAARHRGATTLKNAPIEIQPNAVYTLAEVSQILKISDATLRRWVKNGTLRSARIGRSYRILGSHILEALGKPQSA
jgi:excisionase family DNA binding protein